MIEIRFIPDPNTMMANVLAGAIELPIGRGISFEQGLQLRERWTEGVVEFSPNTGVKLWPQLFNPTPTVLSDVRFRRALFHAIDRQQMVETLMHGQAPVAHTTITPSDAEFPDIQDAIVRYAYDARLATQMIEGLGYARGADTMLRDPSGRPLSVELRSSPIDITGKANLSIANDWSTAGVAVSIVDDSPAGRADLEYRATFPAFDMSRVASGAEALITFKSSEARTAQNRYAGQNASNYMNPEGDTLVDRYLTTIPRPERMKALGEVVHHLTDQVVVLDQFYDAQPSAISHRMVNVASLIARSRTNTWNAHLWDVR